MRNTIIYEEMIVEVEKCSKGITGTNYFDIKMLGLMMSSAENPRT